MAIKHAFVSAMPDEGTSGKVSPSHWNASHNIEDNTIEKAKLTTAAQQFMVPSGGIIMWSGSIATIPTGWYLCDGNNGTPDLRNQFVVGAQSDVGGVPQTNLTGSLTSSGGSISHSHTEHGRHTHTITGNTGSEGAHTHAVTGTTGIGSGGVHFNTDGAGTNGQNYGHTHDLSTTSGAGSSHTHSMTSGTAVLNSSGTSATTHSTTAAPPPYLALAFIMKA